MDICFRILLINPVSRWSNLASMVFSSQRLSEKPSKFNLSGDASAGYAWKASSGSGQVFPIMYLRNSIFFMKSSKFAVILLELAFKHKSIP